MTDPVHIDHLLDDWLDGRLDGDERARAERHLAECAACRRRGEALAAVRSTLRACAAATADDATAGQALHRRILAALDDEDARAAASEPAPFAPRHEPERRDSAATRRSLLLAAAAAVTVVVGLARLLPRRRGADPVEGLTADFAHLATAELPAGLRANAAAVIEQRWRDARLDFHARVLDLTMMGVALEGGGAFRLNGKLAARTVYRADSGRIVCTMVRAALGSLPPAPQREHGGFTFKIFARGTITVVAWQEGEVLCALAGAGDPEALVQLAFAKAMAPAPPAV